jgi:threonylcarbamoyladenosine tRNA methylthiotransferase MtaB
VDRNTGCGYKSHGKRPFLTACISLLDIGYNLIMKISLLSLGCKVNQAEISEMESAFLDQGHMIVGLKDNPEVCIINTCSVTLRSENQSRQLIRRAGRAGARVLATGCYAQLNPGHVSGMKGAITFVGNADKCNIIRMVHSNSKSKTCKSERSRTRLFLKIQDGCNYSCSYCIITKARGASASVETRTVIARINRAVDEGYREVVLCGVHIGLYGLDLEASTCISELVKNILDKTAIYRIRLSSLEPGEIDDRLIGLLGDSRLCPHLHIPLQSGDDRVLRLMKRKYDVRLFNETIDKITKKHIGVSIGTDIIAGFPQENDAEFMNTYNLARETPFAYMHIFPFSGRKGTVAAEMDDIVGDKVRSERASRLRDLAVKKKISFMNKQIGVVLDVLVERHEPENGEYWTGTSENYLKVRATGSGCIKGSIVPVEITGIENNVLLGKPIKGM